MWPALQRYETVGMVVIRSFLLTSALALLAGCASGSPGSNGDGGIDAAIAQDGHLLVTDAHADAAPDAAAPAPVVTITQMPMATTTQTSAAFAFSANVASTFFCQLDTATATACTSPQIYSSLALGEHTFTVVANDGSGSNGMATATWTIVQPCTTSLIEAESIAATGWTVASGDVLHAGAGLESTMAGASFSFSFTGQGLTMYTENGNNLHNISVAIDVDQPIVVDTNAMSFSFQNANVITESLAEGMHTVTITCPALYCSVDYFTVDCAP